jgi:hypothetical protein
MIIASLMSAKDRCPNGVPPVTGADAWELAVRERAGLQSGLVKNTAVI